MNTDEIISNLRAQEEHLRRSAANRRRGNKFLNATVPDILKRADELKAIREAVREMVVVLRIANRVLNEKSVRFTGLDQNPDGIRDMVSRYAAPRDPKLVGAHHPKVPEGV